MISIGNMKHFVLYAVFIPVALTGCNRSTDNRGVLHQETEIAELEAKIAALENALEMQQAMPAVNPAPTTPDLNDDLAGTGATVSERGNEVIITVGNEILFSSGSATLTPKAKRSLKQIVNAINNRYPDDAIRIVGHTDNQPIVRTRKKWSDNWELSGARALSVLREIVNAGIPESRIHFAGFGEHQPIAGNNQRSGRSQNRRVEIIVSLP